MFKVGRSGEARDHYIWGMRVKKTKWYINMNYVLGDPLYITYKKEYNELWVSEKSFEMPHEIWLLFED